MTEVTIIVEGGCLVGVYGVDQYRLIDCDDLREQYGDTQADEFVQAAIKGKGQEAIES